MSDFMRVDYGTVKMGYKPGEPDVLVRYSPTEEIELNFDRLEAAIQDLQNTFSNKESKLLNMANKLEEHLREPDAHNPGVMRKK